MTRNEIMQMGRQAGSFIELAQEKDLLWLERFAKLVAQHERDKWERHATRLQTLMDLRETQPNKPCCLAEREACAKVCEQTNDGTPYNLAEACAEAIRARGQA